MLFAVLLLFACCNSLSSAQFSGIVQTQVIAFPLQWFQCGHLLQLTLSNSAESSGTQTSPTRANTSYRTAVRCRAHSQNAVPKTFKDPAASRSSLTEQCASSSTRKFTCKRRSATRTMSTRGPLRVGSFIPMRGVRTCA